MITGGGGGYNVYDGSQISNCMNGLLANPQMFVTAIGELMEISETHQAVGSCTGNLYANVYTITWFISAISLLQEKTKIGSPFLQMLDTFLQMNDEELRIVTENIGMWLCAVLDSTQYLCFINWK